MSKYTTIDRIEIQLRGRLSIKVDNTAVPKYLGESVNQVEVDPDLLTLTIDTQEDFIDEILAQIYVLPLKYSHGIITRCIEFFVISDLLQYHYNVDAYTDNGDKGLVRSYRTEAWRIIQSLTYGLNIPLPNNLTIDSRSNVQPHYLNGETRINKVNDKIITKRTSVIGKWNNTFNLNKRIEEINKHYII